MICDGETFNGMEAFGNAKQEWLKTFMEPTNGIPYHDTFNRVFAGTDPQQFPDCFLLWTQSVRQMVSQEVVAIDGKPSP